jgi:hypothetical protein
MGSTRYRELGNGQLPRIEGTTCVAFFAWPHFHSQAHVGKLKFLAINAVSRKMVHTEFAEERHRLVMLMNAERRKPPFTDPL